MNCINYMLNDFLKRRFKPRQLSEGIENPGKVSSQIHCIEYIRPRYIIPKQINNEKPIVPCPNMGSTLNIPQIINIDINSTNSKH